LCIGQHIRVCIGEPVEWESAIEYRFQSSATECLEHVRRESFTALQRFFGRAGAEGDAYNAGALACDFVEVAFTDASGIAAHTHQATLDCEHANVFGQHGAAHLVDYA